MFKKYFKKIISILLLLIIIPFFAFGNNFYNIFNTVVNAGGAIIEPELILEKRIREKENGVKGEFMLSLEAFYKRDFDDPDSEVVLSVPKDYIIIVDNSEEMNGANDASTKMNAAKKAVKLILNKINSYTDTRVALIGYGDTNNANNTGLYIGNSFKAYSTLDNELYSKAFQTKNDTSYNDLLNAVDAMTSNGECYIDKGLEIAKKILENDNLSDIEYRYKHVIVISGSTQIGNGWGNATYGNNYDGIDVANKALNISYELKNTHNCFIDVVGLHMNSTTSYPPPEPNWNDGVRDDYLKTNAFLCYLSANYPDATSVTNPGSFKQSYNFYKNYVSFTNENYYNFTDYFQNELYFRENAIVYLDEDTVIRDVIDSSFKLIEGTTSDDIKVYLADVNYYTDTFGEKYLLEDDDINVTLSKNSLGQDVIDLKGYNFEANTVLEYNGNYDSGSKLIIEIPITFADKTECGNYINTNTDDTGIYCLNGSSEYRKVESFPKPTIDIPAKVNIKHICETVGDDNLELSINSVYSQLTGYLNEDYDGDGAGDGYELRAISSDGSIISNLKNNENEIISNVMYDSLYKITLQDDSNYEITKIKIKPENSSAYEVQYSNDLEIQIDDNTDITIYTKLKGRTISVSKQWDDINNEDGIRPESVNVEIYQDEVLYDTVEIKNDSNWLYEFFVEDFDKTYTFKEININENYYLKNVEEVSSNNYVLTNNKYGSILINKKDSILGNKLQGAIFKIERKNEDSTWTEVEQIETNEEGIAQLDKLIHGTYRITEEKAPDGYNLEKDRNVTEIEINSSKLDYELTILNRPQTILPETGDNGLLIIISIIFILLMIRRKYMGPLIVTQRVKNARINKNIRRDKKFKFIFNVDGKVRRKHTRKKARISYKN